jgi:hypothetical protein
MTTTAAPQAGEWVTLKAAAERLGLSQDGVRRRLRLHTLKGQRRRTSQGWRMYVWLPAGEDAATPTVFETIDLEDEDANGSAPSGESYESPRSAHAAPGEAYESPGGAQAAPDGILTPAAQRAREMAEYTAVLLAPLHATLKEQAEELGRAKERAATLEARIAELETPPAPEAQNGVAPHGEEQRRWWQRLFTWAAAEGGT